MLYRIGFEVPNGRISAKQVPVNVWATLTGWGMENKAEFAKIQVITQNVEEEVLAMPKQSGGSKVTARMKVVVVLESKKSRSGEEAASASELQEKLEDLAESLGMEFGLANPPSVGFDDRE